MFVAILKWLNGLKIVYDWKDNSRLLSEVMLIGGQPRHFKKGDLLEEALCDSATYVLSNFIMEAMFV